MSIVIIHLCENKPVCSFSDRERDSKMKWYSSWQYDNLQCIHCIPLPSFPCPISEYDGTIELRLSGEILLKAGDNYILQNTNS